MLLSERDKLRRDAETVRDALDLAYDPPSEAHSAFEALLDALDAQGSAPDGARVECDGGPYCQAPAHAPGCLAAAVPSEAAGRPTTSASGRGAGALPDTGSQVEPPADAEAGGAG